MDGGNGGREGAPPAADRMEASCCGAGGMSRGRAALASEGAFPGASPRADTRSAWAPAPEADAARPPSAADPAAEAGSSARIGEAGARRSPGDGGWSGMRRLAGGVFLTGGDGPSANPADGEGPVRDVTEAERNGWTFVFAGLLPDDFPPTRGVARGGLSRKGDRYRVRGTTHAPHSMLR